MSSLGGTAAAVTRYLVGDADPLALAILRWSIGLCVVVPVAVILRARWPRRSDWPAVAGLRLCFFGLFFILYNVALGYTTAARASLALATLPLQTMLVGGLLGIEPLTLRKLIGVRTAVFGVFAARASDLAIAPHGAWRGELIMTGAVPCMAFYNAWSRLFIVRSSALGFLAVRHGRRCAGAGRDRPADRSACRAALLRCGAADCRRLARHRRRCAGVHPLGAGVRRASPTRVASTMAVNPMAAALLASALVGEPITSNLVLCLIAVCAGIWIAPTEPRRQVGLTTAGPS